MLVAVASTLEVDEAILVPHAGDAAETSDREILESLNADEETTTKAPTTTTTTTTTTAAPTTTTTTTATTTTTTTTAAPTTTAVPVPTYKPELVELLRSFGFSSHKMIEQGYSSREAHLLVRRYVDERAERRAAALFAKKRKAKLRRLAKLRAQRLLREERKRKEKEQDYVPESLKKVMGRFHLDWKEAEAKHESIEDIQKDIQTKAAEEAEHIEEEAKEEAKTASQTIAAEFSKGLIEPMAETKRVLALEKKEIETAEETRVESRRLVARVADTVKRRAMRLQRLLKRKEEAIELEAAKKEKDAEEEAVKNAQQLETQAAKEISAATFKAREESEKARRVASAANNWFRDQQLPAMQRFAALERQRLQSRLKDINTENSYKLLALRKKMQED